MNPKAVLFVLANLLAILGVALVVPLVIALVVAFNGGGFAEVYAFAGVASGAVVVGLLLRYLTKSSAGEVRVREGFAIVTFSWLLLTAVGMLPYLLTGATHSVTDAFFETMSGFTTTGASIFPEVEVIPPATMFWRCMTQWLGGMGIVVLSVALLPILGVGGYRLLKAEAPGGVAYEREQPRVTDAAKSLWRLYLGLTGLLTGLLWLEGMDLFDAICHAFTTMSTGGFSTHTESMGYFTSPSIQWTVTLFMVIAGTNFSLHARFLTMRWGTYFENPEFRVYFFMFLASIGVGVWLLSDGQVTERIVRDVAFQVASVVTTTGFATADYNLWPHGLRMLLFLLMFSGACMGSTSGGVKVARLMVYAKVASREAYRLLFPSGIRHIRMGSRVLEQRVVSNILAFGSLFIFLIIVGAVTMSFCGYGIVTSLTASVAALGNIGPGLVAVGPSANWAHLPDVAKWVMALLMMCGRLEIFSVMVLFTSWAWRR